jgi:hypothetical protein
MIVAFVGFHAYINEMHGSRRKISSKNPVSQRCAEGFNSGVKGLNIGNCKIPLISLLTERLLAVSGLTYMGLISHDPLCFSNVDGHILN